MEKERKLYDKFVNVLNDVLDNEPTPAHLKIVREFLHDNNVNALPEKHQGLGILADKTNHLPFAEEDFDEIE